MHNEIKNLLTEISCWNTVQEELVTKIRSSLDQHSEKKSCSWCWLMLLILLMPVAASDADADAAIAGGKSLHEPSQHAYDHITISTMVGLQREVNTGAKGASLGDSWASQLLTPSPSHNTSHSIAISSPPAKLTFVQVEYPKAGKRPLTSTLPSSLFSF